jgi:hypothetical protein
MKKLLIATFFVFLVALLAYIFFGRGGTPAPNEFGGNGLPFGSAEGVNIPALEPDTVGVVTEFDEQNIVDTPLFRLSNTPVAGFTMLARGSENFVRFVDRATGHIFDAILPSATSTSSLEKRRVTNNTMTKAYEAYFRADGNAVLLRFLDENTDMVKNTALALTAPRSTSTGELYSIAATNFRGDIDSVSVGAGDTLFYSSKESGSILSSNFASGNLRTIFTSAYDNWRLARLGSNLLVYTKASALAPGFAYSLPATGGSLTKILGPLNGLTAIGNPAGTRLLYSYSENGVTKLAVRNMQNGSSNEISPATLAEKCVWSSKESNRLFCGTPINNFAGAEPDNWYLGHTHFTDYIWKFDTASEIAELIAEPKTAFDLDLDVYEPKLSLDERHLVFINKRDMTLWALRLD